MPNQYNLPNISLVQQLAMLTLAASAGDVAAYLFTAPTVITDTLGAANVTRITTGVLGPQHPGAGALIGSTTATLASASLSPVNFTVTGTTITPVVIQGVAYILFPFAGLAELLAIHLLPNGPQTMSQVGDSIQDQLTITLQRAPGQP